MFIRKHFFSWLHLEINQLVVLLRLAALSAFIIMCHLFYTMIVKARSLRRRPTEILYAGESTQNIGEQTVGETTGYRGIGDC